MASLEELVLSGNKLSGEISGRAGFTISFLAWPPPPSGQRHPDSFHSVAVAATTSEVFLRAEATVDAAVAGLDRVAADPRLPLAILAVAAGVSNQGISVAAATYLKNYTQRNLKGILSSSCIYKEFRDQLAQALLRVEPAILRVVIEVFRQVVEKDFLKDNLWSELIPQLKHP